MKTYSKKSNAKRAVEAIQPGLFELALTRGLIVMEGEGAEVHVDVEGCKALFTATKVPKVVNVETLTDGVGEKFMVNMEPSPEFYAELLAQKQVPRVTDFKAVHITDDGTRTEVASFGSVDKAKANQDYGKFGSNASVLVDELIDGKLALYAQGATIQQRMSEEHLGTTYTHLDEHVLVTGAKMFAASKGRYHRRIIVKNLDKYLADRKWPRRQALDIIEKLRKEFT